MHILQVIKTINRNGSTRWALFYLYGFLFLGVFGDFLANEKPLYCRLEGKHYFPVVQQYAVDLGWSHWEGRFIQQGWKEQPYERVVFPLIPYSAKSIDRRNLGARSPFDPQRVSGTWSWHWLGTDMAGHDVAAGLIYGARVSLLVGMIGMLTATLLGIFLGGLAGFFGDHDFRSSRARLVSTGIGLSAGLYLVWAQQLALPDEAGFWGKSGFPASVVILSLLFSQGLTHFLQRYPWWKKMHRIPIDFWITRLTEILNALPTLLFVMAVLAVLERPSIYYVMLIIGFVRWTGISRLVRAELLRVRNMQYIEAAKALGFRSWHILIRHALPNSLGPVWVTLAFGMAGAILVEASLSFLGIGLPVETVTWGSLMRQVTSANIRPWWLIVFPGTAIFLTVLSFNILGEALSDVFDPRRRTNP